MRTLIARMYGLFFLLLSLTGCAQVPNNRPAVQRADYDKKLTRLLPFDTPHIGVDELHANPQGYQLLDARAPEEFAVSHLPGATFIGYGGDYDPAVLDQLDKSQPVVVYCSVGYRSDKVGEKLMKAGFTDVRNLYGSIFEWANRGFALKDAAGNATRRVHTYNEKWGQWMVNPAYERVH